MSNDTDQPVVKSAGYELLHNLLYDYTQYINEGLEVRVLKDEIPSGWIDSFIVERSSTIDTFFQRVKSYFN